MIDKKAIDGGLPRPMGPLSRGILAGNTLYIAGAVGVDRSHNVGDGIREQTRLTLENIKAVVEGAGGTMDDVVNMTVYLVNLADFAAMNEVYATFFNQPCPARATLVCNMARADLLVEMQGIAVLNNAQAGIPQ